MGTLRKTWNLRGKDILYVEENHDGRYGAKGKKRQPKRKLTPEDVYRVNHWNKIKKARLTPENRPQDMKTAQEQFRDAMGKIKKIYKKGGKQLFWIRNIEKGTKGAWHIHFVINDIGTTASLIERAWPYGGVYITRIKKSKCPEEDFHRLAAYITKDKNTREVKQDGNLAKPRIKESSYSHSRNMPLPDPKPKKLVRWQKEIKIKKGYYIAESFEGVNPVTGYKYRRYTLIKLNRRI
jgi:hypothetical protein